MKRRKLQTKNRDRLEDAELFIYNDPDGCTRMIFTVGLHDIVQFVHINTLTKVKTINGIDITLNYN